MTKKMEDNNEEKRNRFLSLDNWDRPVVISYLYQICTVLDHCPTLLFDAEELGVAVKVSNQYATDSESTLCYPWRSSTVRMLLATH